jgi:hypothetical protein
MKTYNILMFSFTKGVQSPNVILVNADEHEANDRRMILKRGGEVVAEFHSQNIRGWWID